MSLHRFPSQNPQGVGMETRAPPGSTNILLMDKILHDLKDSKLWELWYIPYNG